MQSFHQEHCAKINNMIDTNTLPPKLAQIVKNMQANPDYGLSLINLDNMARLVPFSPLTRINNDYGGISEMLEKFHEKGVKKVRVIECKRHGSSSIKTGYQFDLSLTQDEPEVEDSAPLQHNQNFAPMQKQPEAIFAEPMLHGTFGLNAATLAKAQMHDDIKAELREAKGQIKEYELTIKKLEKKLQKRKDSGLDQQLKSDSENEKIKALTQPHVVGFLGKLLKMNVDAAPAANVPLGAPQDLSPEKQDCFNIIGHLSDDQAYNVGLLMSAMLQNEAIEVDVLELLKKYNLLPQ